MVISTEKIRVGVVGTGFGRQVQMPAIAAATGYDLVSVCSRSLDNAAAAAAEFGARHSTDDHRQLIADGEVDLVVISTPPHLHEPMAIDAMDAGKHVICEKPMALDRVEAEAMLRAAQVNDVVHVIDHEQRYLPPNRQFAELVADGFIGELRYFDVRICLPLTVNPAFPFAYHSWRDEAANGGGLLSGIFSHYVDLMRLSFGEIADVAGHATTALKTKPFPEGSGMAGEGEVTTDDRVAIAGRLENGALFTMAGSWSIHHGVGLRVEAFGDAGTLVLPDPDTIMGATSDDEALVMIESEFPLPDGGEGHTGAFIRLLDDLEPVLRGESDGGHYATFDDGLRVQEFIDAVRAGS